MARESAVDRHKRRAIESRSFAAKAHQQVEGLGLHGNDQRRGRLVQQKPSGVFRRPRVLSSGRGLLAEMW